MPLFVANLRRQLDEPEEVLPVRAARRLRVPPDAIRLWAPVRRSLDARDHDDVHFVYNLELALHDPRDEERALSRLHRQDVRPLAVRQPPPVCPGDKPLRHRPVIVGFGPAGMFAALLLAEHGYRPIVLERGRDVRTRHRDIMLHFYRHRQFNPESNLLFGEGGAGTYSDGKLYTRIRDPWCRFVLETFYRFGAHPDILIDSHPHIGSDRLPGICRRMRLHIERLGGEVRFGWRVRSLCTADGRITGVETDQGHVPAEALLLAIGHSARDTCRMLADCGVRIVAKPFQMGVRIEHPQAMIDRWRFGDRAGTGCLRAAHYNVVAKRAAGDHGDVFTFCMCPGGTILPTNESPGEIATNGASRSSRNGPFGNAGLVVTLDPPDFGNDPLAGIAFQERWERLAFDLTGRTYALPAQRAPDFLAGRRSSGHLETSYPLGSAWSDIHKILPRDVAQAIANAIRMLDRPMPGFAGPEAIVTGPETRASSPARILRDPTTRESVSLAGLYPVGEGAGYAGGIISAATDGLETARVLISRYAPAG